MRVYIRKLGSRNYKNYTQETLNKALDDIKNKKISLNQASKRYKIAKGTEPSPNTDRRGRINFSISFATYNLC